MTAEEEAAFQRFVAFLNRRGYGIKLVNQVVQDREGKKYIVTESGAIKRIEKQTPELEEQKG